MLYGVLELFPPRNGLFVYLNLIYPFYDFKEYILRVISSKNIYPMFLNEIIINNYQICLIAQF
jgi:hypothetical protein